MLTQAKTEQADVDMHALDSALALKKANELSQKDTADVKQKAKAVEAKKTEIQNLSLKMEAATDDSDKLRLADKIEAGQNELNELVSKQKITTTKATRTKSKTVRVLHRRNKFRANQQSPQESITKLTAAEIGAKVEFENSKSEKDSKAQEHTEYKAVAKLFTETQEKAEAAKILAEKAKELTRKKIKSQMVFHERRRGRDRVSRKAPRCHEDATEED